ncbi:hypothetical protein ACAF76_007210 [Brevibacillus sp. TJ4]|uniref:hypothetical protein n=1 Tax=Brevibacillus sp. TJ4 TaxID=3234853 RepID=UPI0037CE1854
MKKLKMHAIACLSAVFLLAGCSGDPVKEDAAQYLETDLLKVAAQEKLIIEQFAQISASNLDPDSLYQALDEQVVGKYASFVEELEKIQPKTPEVQQVHAQYVEAVRMNQEAFHLIAESLKEKNNEQYNAARAKLAEASEKIKESKEAMKQLADQYDIQ